MLCYYQLTTALSCSHASGTSASVLPQRHKVRAAKYRWFPRCARTKRGTRENMAFSTKTGFFVGQNKAELNSGRFFVERSCF